MQQRGQTLTGVQDAMATRDRQDQSRVLAPLFRAPEARVIDTTDLTIDEVVNIMLSEVRTSISQRNV
jgi:cytidylate kinase